MLLRDSREWEVDTAQRAFRGQDGGSLAGSKGHSVAAESSRWGAVGCGGVPKQCTLTPTPASLSNAGYPSYTIVCASRLKTERGEHGEWPFSQAERERVFSGWRQTGSGVSFHLIKNKKQGDRR